MDPFKGVVELCALLLHININDVMFLRLLPLRLVRNITKKCMIFLGQKRVPLHVVYLCLSVQLYCVMMARLPTVEGQCQ